MPGKQSVSAARQEIQAVIDLIRTNPAKGAQLLEQLNDELRKVLNKPSE